MHCKYNSLEEVLEYFQKEFVKYDGNEEIPDTEENRIAVMDGLFWCGVNLVRYEYPKESLYKLMRTLWYLRDKWGLLEKEESNAKK